MCDCDAVCPKREYFCFICQLFTHQFLDIVLQIERHGVILQGRLAQLLTEGPSPNPRWLLKFDGQPHKDEEMYERSFGKTLYSMSVDEEGSIGVVTSSASVSSASTQRKPGTATRRTNGNKKSVTSSDDDETEQKGMYADDKKGPHMIDGSNAGSDVESDSSDRRSLNRRASAREERSRRRQAKIDEEIFPNVHEQLLTGGKRRLSSHSTAFHNSKRSRRDGDDDFHHGNNDVSGENGAVIQVNLLTGTLYLYRGKHRRAEFIRRV